MLEIVVKRSEFGVYYTVFVVIIICITFVKLRKYWRVVKRSEFGVYYTLLVVIIIRITFVKLRKCWRML